jgi:hypothetical protein
VVPELDWPEPYTNAFKHLLLTDEEQEHFTDSAAYYATDLENEDGLFHLLIITFTCISVIKLSGTYFNLRF